MKPFSSENPQHFLFLYLIWDLRIFFFCLSLVHKYNIWPTSDFVHFPPPSVFLLRRDLCHLWRKKPSKQTLEVGQLYHCLHAAFLPLCLLNASPLGYATIREIISAACLYKGTILSGSRSWVAEVWNLFTVESPCWPKMGSLTWWLICSTALSELSRSPSLPPAHSPFCHSSIYSAWENAAKRPIQLLSSLWCIKGNSMCLAYYSRFQGSFAA